ncbi:MAG: Gfo/Idh/MocA family protein, partial [Thermoguttaceae bacterium]
MSKTTRREFLKSTAVIAASVSTFNGLTATSYSKVSGANNRVNIAIAGCGGRGNEHIGEFGKLNNVNISCVVDADANRAGAAAKSVEQKFGNAPKSETDIRKMLEDDTIDAVAVASCNHWHSLMGIWAAQAGKDVYVEKPCSQRLFEGRRLLEAAKKYNRLIQHGTQRRSDKYWAQTTAAVRQNKYGKLIAAKVYCHRPRGPLGFKPITDPPANLNWNLWIGPAEMTPYHENLVPYKWHSVWNTGNGEIGNNGVHYFDLCRW